MGDEGANLPLSIAQHKVTTCAINASGEWLAFGSSALGQLLVWEWQSESYVLRQQGHAFPPTSLAYSPDGQTIVTGGDDCRVKLWNVSSGFCFVTFSEHTGPVTAVHVAASGQVVVSASKDGTVRAYDLLRYRNFRYGCCLLPVEAGWTGGLGRKSEH
jgi:periodic tryptophan protein 2